MYFSCDTWCYISEQCRSASFHIITNTYNFTVRVVLLLTKSFVIISLKTLFVSVCYLLLAPEIKKSEVWFWWTRTLLLPMEESKLGFEMACWCKTKAGTQKTLEAYFKRLQTCQLCCFFVSWQTASFNLLDRKKNKVRS